MSAVLAEFCRSIHRLYWLLISSLGYSVLMIGLICIVLGLTLPVYLLRDIIRNSLGGMSALAELAEHTADRAAPAAEPVGTVPAAVRIFLQWRDLSSPGCCPEQSDLPDLPDQWA